MDAERSDCLLRAAKQFGTPLYIYFIDDVLDRLKMLEHLFGGRFSVSFAVKSNPNKAILRHLLGHVGSYDVSSFAEVERVLLAGCRAQEITFSGPGKRDDELRRSVMAGVGELVCESLEEAVRVDSYARDLGANVDILVRLNPLRIPKDFGVNMAGRPTQFGIDEEAMMPVLESCARLQNARLVGIHIYSGTNCLSAHAIAENFSIFLELFDRACRHIDLRPSKLVFGSGFGIPYLPDDRELDVAAIAAAVNPMIDAFRGEARYRDTSCILEMGRWLIGQAGYLLTSIIGEKASRGTEFRICDAGFNNQLSACGMMGTVIRRNWRIAKLANGTESEPGMGSESYNLVGPLCTTIDLIAAGIKLPRLRRGDVLAIESSGAYGLTASPTRFISHPEPREIIVSDGGEFTDVTESLLNHWSGVQSSSGSRELQGGA